jgi:PAS domain S-box-containing protein
LLISGRAPDEVRIEGFEHGADDYLAKPYSERELRARIRAVLRTVEMRRQATRREANEDAERRATAERAALLESITEAFYAIDRKWRFTYANQRALDYFGKSREEVIGKNVWETFPEAKGTVFQTEYERAMTEERAAAFEALSPFTERWLDVHIYPTPQGLAVNFRDITTRKIAEQEREAALNRERHAIAQIDALFATAPVGLAFVDDQLRFRQINERLAEMNGLSVEAHLGKRPDEILPKLDDLQLILAKWREVIERGEPWLGVEVQGETPAAPGLAGTWLESFFPVRVAGKTTGLGIIVQDITQQKASELELRESQQRYRAFVNHSSEGIWRYELNEPLDLSTSIEDQMEHAYRHARLAELNDAMARMFRYERAEDLLDAPLAATMPPDDEAARAYLRRVVEARFSVVAAESSEPDKQGNIHYFENSIVPVIEDGKLLRVWGVQRDITERKQAEERLKQSDRRKDEFLAQLAHELRNPLAPIRNGVQIFKLRATSDELLQRTARMLDRQMAHLVRLVDDLLEMSRITHGKLELRMQRLHLAEVLARAIEASRVFVDAKGHELSVNVLTEDIEVYGDPDRLVQVFTNLLANSAKYTDSGGRITIALSRSERDAKVEVHDTGIGIPVQALANVFEMFSQVDSNRGRSGEGLGIGLALARTLVEMHGGTVRAASEGRGKGSTFTVCLPLASSIGTRNVPMGEPVANEVSSQGRKRRVLVVDDNEDAAQTLAMLLQMDGHIVKTAADGEQAVAAANEFDPDIIFMDLGMPRMDGLQATQAIRDLPGGRRSRIVALTGWGQEHDVRRTRSAGMDHHLTKPVDPESLSKLMASFVEDGERLASST